MKPNLRWPFNLSVLFLSGTFIFPALSYAQYTQEKIINEFIDFQHRSPDEVDRGPRFENPFPIPRLNDVIPVYMQQRLRRRDNNRGELIFGGLKRSIDFRHRDTPVKSQVGARCSAYGLISSIENLLGEPSIAKISEAHLWSNYKRYSSVSAVEAAKRMSITEHEMWPHDSTPRSGWERKAHTSLQHITFIEDDVVMAVKTLNDARPIYLGVSVTQAMANCDAVLDPNSKDTGGGHALSISGYTLDKRIPGGGYFILKGSWGPDCGDRGYQYMPFNYCTRGGSSYCIMWDVQGVKTAFPGVRSVEPVLPDFDMNKIQVSTSSYRRWYQLSRTVVMKIEGQSLHVRQIKDVSFSVDGGSFSSPVKNDIDNVILAFMTRASAHNIALKITLKNGKVVESKHQWRL